MRRDDLGLYRHEGSRSFVGNLACCWFSSGTARNTHAYYGYSSVAYNPDFYGWACERALVQVAILSAGAKPSGRRRA